jgi:hypothetical protein
LVCKYESLANKYEHDIKSFSYRTKVEEEANDVLEAQLANLTSEHMALQANHKELECSHEKLVDPYASLGIAHEVVISSDSNKMNSLGRNPKITRSALLPSVCQNHVATGVLLALGTNTTNNLNSYAPTTAETTREPTVQRGAVRPGMVGG